MRYTNKLIPALLLLTLMVACGPSPVEQGDVFVQQNLKLTNNWPTRVIRDNLSGIHLILQATALPEVPVLPFAGWEINEDHEIQTSILPNLEMDHEFGQMLLHDRYNGYVSMAQYVTDAFDIKLYRLVSALEWEELLHLTGDSFLFNRPFDSDTNEVVICEGSIGTQDCTLKALEDDQITTVGLPSLLLVGSPFKFHSDGRAVVYDFDNELIYYRAAHEDPWTNIALPAAFTASSPWYVVFFEFQLVSDGFWALLNVNHEEYGDEHRSRFCHYVTGVGWNECLEIEGRRMDAAVALADDSLHIFGVKSTPVGYEDYYHTFIHWPVDDIGVGAATEVAFPRDLTPNEYGYVQTEPMMFADTGGDEGYVLVNYTSKYVQGTTPTAGKMLYHLNDGALEYVTEVQDLLDGQMVFRIYPIGRDRYLSSRQYN